MADSEEDDGFAKQGAGLHPKNVLAETLRTAREVSVTLALQMVLRILRRCARAAFPDADPVFPT